MQAQWTAHTCARSVSRTEELSPAGQRPAAWHQQGREERALRHWLTSLGAQLTGGDLADDLRDGLLLLKVCAGCVQGVVCVCRVYTGG